ncbi:potassium channel family protein [Natrialba asiatica]|nr:NAD-binding protein [Natrialba asiatica]
MAPLTRRILVYLASLLALTALYTVTYQWGMAVYEGESRTWYQAFEIVVQSMTTTGYGQDAPWESLWMNVLMVLIQVTGIAYIAVAIPQFITPWLRQVVQPAPPAETEAVADHVVIIGYSDNCERLVDELGANGTPHVVLEGETERAQTLHEAGLTVVHRDPSTAAGLEAARLGDALAVVVDATERELIRAVLAIERYEPTATVLVLVADPSDARYFRYAGIDEVISLKHRLGKALGDKVRDVVTLDIEEDADFEAAFDIVEYHVDPGSDLFGETVASTRRLEQTGATVLGAWIRGDFVTILPERVRVDENTSLLIAGTESELNGVAKRTGTPGSHYREIGDPVIVVGTGLVGTTAAGTLIRAGLETTVVDTAPAERVDVVGDATEEETLLEAGIRDARTLILALDTDERAILTTLTARALNPELDIIVGANATSSVAVLHTAGADDVLALPNVAGRMVTLRIFEHETMTLGDRLRVARVSAPALAGEELSAADIRLETGCTVIALDRDGTFFSTPDGMELQPTDVLVVSGTGRQVRTFRTRYGNGRAS